MGRRGRGSGCSIAAAACRCPSAEHAASPAQTLELRLDGNTLVYIKGSKSKLLDLAHAASVSPLQNPVAWKLTMRGDEAFEFYAG